MTHSIMFHHFHDQNHVPAQGSLSSDDFEEMLDWLIDQYEVLNAPDYLKKLESGCLTEHDVCLSFDDALLCQWSIAAPILRRRKLQAFFFVYSSVCMGSPDFLEIFRHFRMSCFDSVDKFYEIFFNNVKALDELNYRKAQKKYKELEYLTAYEFYTESDRWFRYLRDHELGTQRYNHLMYELMESKGFDPLSVADRLWMTDEHLKALYEEGHMIGLHSLNHPTRMSTLSCEDQYIEYSQNLQHLEHVLGQGAILSMSHPCGDYNDDTLSLLKNMGIKIGFRSNLATTQIKSFLEIPRDDHANIYRKMRDENYALQQQSASTY